VSCLSNVANVSGLSSSCVLPVKCCQCLWIVFVLCLVCQMLPMSLDCLRHVSCLSYVASVSLATFERQDTGRRQSREIDNIWQTRHRTKTIQRHWQHLTDKTQDEDNPETLATFDRQDTGRRQSRDTGNIWQTRHRLSMTLDFLRPVSCLSNVTTVSGLSSSCVLSVKCCQCLWIVFVLCLACQMLPMALDCLRPVSCLSNVANVSGLSSSCVLRVKCCQCLWIVFVLCLSCQMLPMSLDFRRPVSCLSNVANVSGLSSSLTATTQDEDNPETLATFDRQDTGRRQSRDIGNIWQVRHRTKTIQRHWQHLTGKTHDEDNPETLATFDR
jgi:galactokinase